MTTFLDFFIKTVRKLRKTEKEEERLRKQISQKAIHLEKQALAQQEVMSLQKISEEFTTQYQEALREVKNEHINMFRNISKNIESNAKAEMANFTKILREELLVSQKNLGKKIEDEYQTVETELRAYKEKKLAEIDDAVYKIVSAAAKEVLGKALSFDEHEELVLKALEDAKANGFFKP